MDVGDVVLWNGILCVKGAYACPAQLTSVTYFNLPGELGRCLNLKWQWKNISSLTSYLKYVPEAGTLCDREVYAKGWYFNSCSLKPLDSRERFARIKDHLHKTGSISVVKMGEDILLVTPDTKMTEDLGLLQDDQRLHCIVLSRQSRSFSAPKIQTMPDSEVFVSTPPSSSMLTKDSLQHVFLVNSEDQSIVTSYGDNCLFNKAKKSSLDDKRVAQSVDEHPERKRHKSEHSPCVMYSPDIPLTPVTKHDKLKSKRKRHKSETPRKKSINRESPNVKLVTNETIGIQGKDKHSDVSLQAEKNSSSVKITEDKHTMARSNVHKEDKENMKRSLSAIATDEKLKDKDQIKKQQLEGGSVQGHDKKKTKEVSSEKKLEHSREKEKSSKKHTKDKVSKLTVLEKKQLESEKVLSQLNLSHTKEDFSSLGRIPKKKPKEKQHNSDTVKRDSESQTEKKRESSISKERKSSNEKKKETSEKREKKEKGRDNRSVTDHKQDLEENISGELTHERDHMSDDLFKLKYDPVSSETPFSRSQEKCFQSIRNDYQAFTNEKNKHEGSTIPGFGDLDKLRMIECKERHLKVKRFIRKTEDGLLVKIKDNDKGLELWNDVDSWTGFVKQSLHRMSKYDSSLSDIDAFQQLWADKIHEEDSPNDRRKATVDKSDPYDIKIQLQISTDLTKKSRIMTESNPIDIHIKLQNQDVMKNVSDETKLITDLLKSNSDTCSMDNVKDSFSSKIVKICEGEQSRLAGKKITDKENVCDGKLHLANVTDKTGDSKTRSTSKSPIKSHLSVKSEELQTSKKLELDIDIKDNPLPKQIIPSKPNTDLPKSIILNEDIKTGKNDSDKYVKYTDEKSKSIKNDTEEISFLKDIKNRTERRNSGEKSRHVSGSSKSSITQPRFLDVKTDIVSTGCELSERRSSAKREGSLHQRLGKIADMSVPEDKKIKKSDKRHERQFHPYKKDDRSKISDVPTWSFDIAYNDMEELLQNMTENVFKVEYRKPADVRKWRKGSCRTSLGSVKGRFYGHRFSRSKIPDSLPNYSDAREEEYDINPVLISNMEERARQADIVEESWQNVPKEETSFIEEMCIYGQDKEEAKAKSSKEESNSSQRIVKPDVSLVIPGMGKTFLYSGEDLSGMGETKDEFLQDNKGEREWVETKMSPKREKKSEDKSQKGAELINMKKECKKNWHEKMVCPESSNQPIKGKHSNVILANKKESLESYDSFNFHTVGMKKTEDEGSTKNEKEILKAECGTKNSLVVQEKCRSEEEKHTTLEKNKKTSGRSELRILSSESDICLDWSDEDVVKEETDSEDDHDDETFVVIDTVEDYGSDTADKQKDITQGCGSETPKNSPLGWSSYTQETQRDAAPNFESDAQGNQEEATLECGSCTPEKENCTTVCGSETPEKQEDTTQGCGSYSPDSQEDATFGCGSYTPENQKDLTLGCGSYTPESQKDSSPSYKSDTQENQKGLTIGCGLYSSENKKDVEQGNGSYSPESHRATSLSCESDTPVIQKDAALGCGSYSSENQKDSTQGYGSETSENKKDTTQGCVSETSENKKDSTLEIQKDATPISHYSENQKDVKLINVSNTLENQIHTTLDFESLTPDRRKDNALGCDLLSSEINELSKQNKQEDENNGVQTVSAEIDCDFYNKEPESKKLVPYLCESDENDSEDEYSSDVYNTVDEVTDCDNPNTQSELEEASAFYRKLSIANESDGNEVVEKCNLDNNHTHNDGVADCSKSNFQNLEKVKLKKPQNLLFNVNSKTVNTNDNSENFDTEIRFSPDYDSETCMDNNNSIISDKQDGTEDQCSTALYTYNDENIQKFKNENISELQCKEKNGEDSQCKEKNDEDSMEHQHTEHEMLSEKWQKSIDTFATIAVHKESSSSGQVGPLKKSILAFKCDFNDAMKQEEKLTQLDDNVQTNTEQTVTEKLAFVEENIQLYDTTSGQENRNFECIEGKETQKGDLYHDFTKVQLNTPCSVGNDDSENKPMILNEKSSGNRKEETGNMLCLGNPKVESPFNTNQCPIEEYPQSFSASCNYSVSDQEVLSVTDSDFDEAVIDIENKGKDALKCRDEDVEEEKDSFSSLIKRCEQNRKKLVFIHKESYTKLETDNKAAIEQLNENQDQHDSYLQNMNKPDKDNLDEETSLVKSNNSNEDVNLLCNSTQNKSSNPSKKETELKTDGIYEKNESKLDKAYREFEISLGLNVKESIISCVDDNSSSFDRVTQDEKDIELTQGDIENQNHILQDNEANKDLRNQHDAVTNENLDEEPEILITQQYSTDDDSQLSDPNISLETISSDLEQTSNNESFNSGAKLKVLDEYNSDSSKSMTDSEKQYTIKFKPIGNPDRFENKEPGGKSNQFDLVTEKPTSFIKPSQTWETFYSDSLSNKNENNSTKKSYKMSDVPRTNLSTLATKVKKKKMSKNKLRSISQSTTSIPFLTLGKESSYASMSTTPLVCSMNTISSSTIISTSSSGKYSSATQSSATLSSASYLSALDIISTSSSMSLASSTSTINPALSATTMHTFVSTTCTLTTMSSPSSHTTVNVPSATTVHTSSSNTSTLAVSSPTVMSTPPSVTTKSSGPCISPISPASSDSALNAALFTATSPLSNITTSQSLYNFHPYNSAEWPMMAPSSYPGYGVYPTSITTPINNIGIYTPPSQNLQAHTSYNYSLHDQHLWFPNYSMPPQQHQWYGPFYPIMPFHLGPSGNRRGGPRPRSHMHSYRNNY